MKNKAANFMTLISLKQKSPGMLTPGQSKDLRM